MAAFSSRWFFSIVACVATVFSLGCQDDSETIRRIQSQRQAKMQSQTQQDHLAELFSLLSRLIELNPDEARRQIAYHANRWAEDRRDAIATDAASVSPLVKTVRDVLPEEEIKRRILRRDFAQSDVDHLRDAYLFRQVIDWVNVESSDDPILADWFASLGDDGLSDLEIERLRTASRLFDWTVRNICYEPNVSTEPLPPAPPMSMGMTFQGAGYRQTDYLTLMRGTGDALQRAGVFTQLCRQAGIDAFVLGLAPKSDGASEPWCVGVLIGDDVYLFEPDLGIFVPGPDQTGIATLAEARSDASVLRRLNVAGFFDYPLSKENVQQCIAILNVVPEALSDRMKLLQSGLAGDRRMVTHVDVDEVAKRIDAVKGIAGVRLWDVPILADFYIQDMQLAAERDPLFSFWYNSRWAILESPIDNARQLALGRWRHLHGDFDNDADENPGARVLYLSQRSPEFEIEDLRIDVDLQKAYGIRRGLGVDPTVYDRQVQQVQGMMRQGKRVATYWISLIHYDDVRYDTAETWLTKRVLGDEQLSFWEPSARYNLARTEERLGNTDRAVELYKTDGLPQEHGNRIRARLVGKLVE